MDNGGASFLILGLGDPLGLKGRAQNGATDPDQLLPLWGRNHLDLQGGGGQGSDFLAEPFRNAGEHSRSTAHHDVVKEVFSDVNVALHDGLVGYFVEARHFFADQHRLEQSFGAPEPLRPDDDGLSVRQFVALVILSRSVIGCIGHFLPTTSAS